MNRCLICFKSVEETLNDNHVCNKCLAKFKIIEKVIYFENTEILILYEYNDFFSFQSQKYEIFVV